MDLSSHPAAAPTPDLAPWRRMAKYIHQQVRSNPDILALESSRRRGRAMVNAHELAIWLAYEPSIESGGWDVRYEITGAGWWSPVSRKTGDRLVAELVEGLLEEWVRWRGDPHAKARESNLRDP